MFCHINKLSAATVSVLLSELAQGTRVTVQDEAEESGVVGRGSSGTAGDRREGARLAGASSGADVALIW